MCEGVSWFNGDCDFGINAFVYSDDKVKMIFMLVNFVTFVHLIVKKLLLNPNAKTIGF